MTGRSPGAGRWDPGATDVMPLCPERSTSNGTLAVIGQGTSGSTPLDILGRLDGVHGAGPQFSARCPAHDDRNASLSVHQATDRMLVHCHAGCDTRAVLEALGLTERDLFTSPVTGPATSDTWTPCGHGRVAEYLYRDEAGEILYAVTRCPRKCFAQWRPDRTSQSGRRWNLHGVRRVPYRLPDVLAVVAEQLRNVWVVEGEKDADRLWSLGIPATCNSGGARKWTEDHARYLTGADVVVVPDLDDVGRKHAQKVVNSLLSLARSVLVLEPAAGKDISDHLDARLGLRHLVQVAEPLPGPGCEVTG